MMNTVREIEKINEAELRRGLVGTSSSWHETYRGSAWVFAGGLPFQLTEGDVLCVFSQWGEIEDLHLVRDEHTGKSKGFAFVKYEDWRSTVLAVDNMNGALLLGQTVRVDHKTDYRPPRRKDVEEHSGDNKLPAYEPGHAYKDKVMIGPHSLSTGVDLFAPRPPLAPAEGAEGSKPTAWAADPRASRADTAAAKHTSPEAVDGRRTGCSAERLGREQASGDEHHASRHHRHRSHRDHRCHDKRRDESRHSRPRPADSGRDRSHSPRRRHDSRQRRDRRSPSRSRSRERHLRDADIAPRSTVVAGGIVSTHAATRRPPSAAGSTPATGTALPPAKDWRGRLVEPALPAARSDGARGVSEGGRRDNGDMVAGLGRRR